MLAINAANSRIESPVLILIIVLWASTGSKSAGDEIGTNGRKMRAGPTVVVAMVASEGSQPMTGKNYRSVDGTDRLKPIGEVSLPPRADLDRMPADMAAKQFGTEPGVLQHGGASRAWDSTLYAWEAPALCHRPLYFEDENLERNGRSFGIFQPAVSTGHACTRLAALPYMMGVVSPHECVYTLGKDRPGTCAPYYLCRPPLSLRGALYEAGAVTGLAFIVP
jgi:hypothetical protein